MAIWSEDMVVLSHSAVYLLGEAENGLVIPVDGCLLELDHFDKILGSVQRKYFLSRSHLDQLIACLITADLKLRTRPDDVQ